MDPQPGPIPGYATANWLIRGRLIQAGYPGSSDEAAARDIRQAVIDAKVTTIVCLEPEAELGPLPPYLAAIDPSTLSASGTSPLCEWLHFPFADGGVPPDAALAELVQRCLERLSVGEVLLVHCLGGHGRAGVVCACLAGAHLGLSGADALALVQQAHSTREDPWARRHKSPETSVQREQVIRMLADGVIQTDRIAASATQSSKACIAL